MTFGAWMFACVVLVLAVYHAKFRKLVLILAGLAVVGVAGVYVYGWGSDYIERRHQEKLHKQLVVDCLNRFKRDIASPQAFAFDHQPGFQPGSNDRGLRNAARFPSRRVIEIAYAVFVAVWIGLSVDCGS